MLNKIQAKEFAEREFIPVGNVYPAGAWKVRQIRGPLSSQRFPT